MSSTSSAESGRIRKRCLYHGEVQGVGFRATAHDCARRFDVAGHVKNLPDGRVELVAEGTPGEVHRFLADVAEKLDRHIHDATVLDEPPQHVDGFRIEH